MSLLALVLSAAAITLVFVDGDVFDFVRRGPAWWVQLSSCPLCSGVWIGWGWSAFWLRDAFAAEVLRAGAEVFAVGALSGVAAMGFSLLFDALESWGAPARAARRAREGRK